MKSAGSPQVTSNWREHKVVLVPQASALGMIAVIRSLGRAGYQVHACSSDPGALGLRSNMAVRSSTHPAYEHADFIPWLFSYIDEHAVDVIIPSEGFLIAIRPVFALLQPILAIGTDEKVIYDCFSKCDVQSRFLNAQSSEGLNDNLPPSLLWNRGQPLPVDREINSLGLPLFIKVDGLDSLTNGEGDVFRVDSVPKAAARIRQLSSLYSSLLIQGFVPGTRVVADFCIWKGQIISRSMMIAKHENPHYGGVSTLRSLSWDEEIWLDAERKLRYLGLEGVAMMEYRRDPNTGAFNFIEINARYWLGLHVEIMSGIDIPVIQIDAFFDYCTPEPEPDHRPARPSQVRYTVPGDIGYVISVVKDSSVPVKRKIWVFIEFFLLSLDPRIKSDLYFPGDRRLYFIELFRFCYLTLLRKK